MLVRSSILKILLAYVVAGLVVFFLAFIAPGLAANRDYMTIKGGIEDKSEIEVVGTLQCTFTNQENSSNTGEACIATLLNAETGQSLALDNAGVARRLFMEGKRNVALKGQMTRGGALKIASARALN